MARKTEGTKGEIAKGVIKKDDLLCQPFITLIYSTVYVTAIRRKLQERQKLMVGCGGRGDDVLERLLRQWEEKLKRRNKQYFIDCAYALYVLADWTSKSSK